VIRGALAALVAACVASTALAHSDLQEQIDRANAQLQDTPDAAAYLARGSLHRRHGDWPQALSDLHLALAQDPNLAAARLELGLAWLEQARPDIAEPWLLAYVAARPTDGFGHRAMARVQAALARPLVAAEALDRAIAHLEPPSPGDFLRRAELLAEAGQAERALNGLGEGLDRLGPLATLIEAAMGIEMTRSEPEAALTWLGRLPRAQRERPGWLLRSGDLHEAAGNDAAALADWRRGLEGMEALPPQRRRSPAMTTLEATLRERLLR
jgi:tetratricopeptide (TPR) repeat protein